jgi:hypothetical protein
MGLIQKLNLVLGFDPLDLTGTISNPKSSEKAIRDGIIMIILS